MRKWKCIKVNRGNKDNFTVGKIYETDDVGYGIISDDRFKFRKTKVDDLIGMGFEEVTEFDWNAFESEKLAVHCRTEEEAIDFCKQMDNRGLEWSSGGNHTDCNNWGVYKKDTCYTRSMYSEIDFYKGISRKIVEWRDFMKNEFTKADLKTGHIATTTDGTEYVVLLNFSHTFSNDQDVMLGIENNWLSLSSYDNNLIENDGNSEYDIVKVEEISHIYSVFNFEHEKEARKVLFERIEKSPAQIKLEELESKQREIADEIKKVREEL